MSETVKFLDATFQGKVDGTKILIWTLPDKRSYWCDTVEAAAEVVERVKDNHDVYFGIGLSDEDFGSTKRCPASAVSAIPGVWADFDVQGPGHLKPNLPPSREAIMQLLDDIGLPPTLAVNSGHGLQCVPLDTEILTRDGWKTFDTVSVSEEVLGYDAARGVMSWTTMKGKIVKQNDSLVRVSNRDFSAVCTPGHRWVCDVARRSQRDDNGKRARFWENNVLLETNQLTQTGQRIRLAAWAEAPSSALDVSTNEAALLGWISSDGSFSDDGCSARISQSEKKFELKIRDVLNEVPHTEGRYHPEIPEQITWRISTPWFRELVNRAGLLGDKHSADWSKFVLGLTPESRKAFLDAFWHGDGHSERASKVITQNPGNISEAVKLAILLEGRRPLTRGKSDRINKPSKYIKNPKPSRCKSITYGNPFVRWNLKFEQVGEAPVWCPQTELGTWVMRQGDTICITGNCFWLFEKLFQIDTDTRRLQAQSLSRRWNNTLRALAKRRGWDVDATHDLARVYRVPGTTNRKVKTDLVPVTLLAYNDHRYTLEEIAEKFLPEDLPARTASSNETVVEEDFVLDPNAKVDLDLFDAICECDNRIRATWERKRTDFQDQSGSSYDMALANYGAQAGWNDQQIVNLLINHRRKHGDDLKLRPDYYRMTIRKARTVVARHVAVEQLDNILYETSDEDRAGLQVTPEDQRTATPIISDDTRQKLLKHLSDLLGFNIVNIIKYVSSEPSYRIVTERDGIMLGTVGGLIKQEALRYQVAALTGYYIPKFKTNIWDKIAQSLLNACEEQSCGEEATDQGAIKSWLDLYLSDNTPSIAGLCEETVSNQTPYRDEMGDVYIFGMSFREYLKRKYGEQITQKKVGALLRLHRCEPRVVNCKINGKQTTRSVWYVPSQTRGEFE